VCVVNDLVYASSQSEAQLVAEAIVTFSNVT